MPAICGCVAVGHKEDGRACFIEKQIVAETRHTAFPKPGRLFYSFKKLKNEGK